MFRGVVVGGVALLGATFFALAVGRGAIGSSTATVSRASRATPRAPATGIVYVRSGRLSFMNADGSGQRDSGLRVEARGFPVWSPDGRKLAFPGERRNRVALSIADRNGRNSRAIGPAGWYDCLWLSWAPDSRRIAYTQNGDCGGDVASYTVNVDGTSRRSLPRKYSFDPIWSPDGRRILFTDRYRFFVMAVDGSSLRAIRNADPDVPDGTPNRPPAAWSPDSKRIVYLSGGLYVMNLDGTGRRNLTGGLRVFSFAPSPDWRQIAIAADDGRIRDIYVLDADGGNLRKLTSARRVVNDDPQWSPDGRRLSFSRRTGSLGAASDIYVIDVDGSGERNLTRSPATNDRAAVWVPNLR